MYARTLVYIGTSGIGLNRKQVGGIENVSESIVSYFLDSVCIIPVIFDTKRPICVLFFRLYVLQHVFVACFR